MKFQQDMTTKIVSRPAGDALFADGFKETVHDALISADDVFQARKGAALHFSNELLVRRDTHLLHFLAHGIEIAILLAVPGERRLAVSQQVLGEQELDITARTGNRSRT